ncbi:uncharacterized protein LOC143860140 [Tasmannia lanceolata]|uniref:uncharacterized protein LOC143860140 n=1 Tax=Tasmannia lanceolata TaxID=3420 RepID=UPI0040649FDD
MASSTNSDGRSNFFRIPALKCHCMKKATLKITDTDINDNQEKVFYSSHFNDGITWRCSYFVWLEDVLSGLEFGPQREFNHLRRLKDEVSELEGLMQQTKGEVSKLKDEVSELKGLMQQMKGEVSKLKVVIQRLAVKENGNDWNKVLVVAVCFSLFLFYMSK